MRLYWPTCWPRVCIGPCAQHGYACVHLHTHTPPFPTTSTQAVQLDQAIAAYASQALHHLHTTPDTTTLPSLTLLANSTALLPRLGNAAAVQQQRPDMAAAKPLRGVPNPTQLLAMRAAAQSAVCVSHTLPRGAAAAVAAVVEATLERRHGHSVSLQALVSLLCGWGGAVEASPNVPLSSQRAAGDTPPKRASNRDCVLGVGGESGGLLSSPLHPLDVAPLPHTALHPPPGVDLPHWVQYAMTRMRQLDPDTVPSLTRAVVRMATQPSGAPCSTPHMPPLSSGPDDDHSASSSPPDRHSAPLPPLDHAVPCLPSTHIPLLLAALANAAPFLPAWSSAGALLEVVWAAAQLHLSLAVGDLQRVAAAATADINTAVAAWGIHGAV